MKSISVALNVHLGTIRRIVVLVLLSVENWSVASNALENIHRWFVVLDLLTVAP